jgi:hypothetical protein
VQSKLIALKNMYKHYENNYLMLLKPSLRICRINKHTVIYICPMAVTPNGKPTIKTGT